jgi:hypothetical protein
VTYYSLKVAQQQNISTVVAPDKSSFGADSLTAQIASYGGAIGSLLLFLLIIRAATKFVQEVKKDD